MRSILKLAFLHALATALYIVLIASLLFYSGSKKFGPQTPTALIPIFILMLLVFSAALTGSLMIGRPILWYLDGKKKEALKLFACTLGIFFVITLVAFGLMLMVTL